MNNKEEELLGKLLIKTPNKIVLLVMDGVGDIHTTNTPKTPLELAEKPNLDRLARESILGLHIPISMGITPGSGPAHLALFGYDPLDPTYNAGRGVLETLGIGFELRPSDIAIRGNFATADPATGKLIDRRAGRISTEECARVCEKLQTKIKQIGSAEIIIRPVKDYRFALILRGDGLSPEVSETDPQRTGMMPLPPKALSSGARKTEEILTKFVDISREILSDEERANAVLLRGISRLPRVPSVTERFGIRAAAIATYPLYRGVAKLVGMELLDTGETIQEEFECLKKHFTDDYDYFFVHIKKTDSAGEDGNLEMKVKIIEEVDKALPLLTDLTPSVLIVTGDHSTPCAMKSHSWHPVPFMLKAPFCDPDECAEFTENACARGRLGIFPAVKIMELALAHSGKLLKFGA